MPKRQRGLITEAREKAVETAIEVNKKILEKQAPPPPPLHIRCRPPSFNDFVGNTSTVNSLKSKLAQGALAHALLFQGPSGCGKTTLARIIKTELGCSDFDFVEINMGNIGGVATAREIIRNIKLRPMQGNCRIYLLDEVQQATKDFQNALLKPLEDTPPYAYFILCTTDPQKLLVTIRNRCAVYEVAQLQDSQIVELLERTTDEEEKPVDDEVITDIMIASDGCPRQAMVILDQIIDLDPRRQRRAIKSYIGQEAVTIELCRALLDSASWEEVQSILANLNEDPEKVRRAVIGYMSAVAIKSDVKSRNGMKKAVRASEIFQCFSRPFYDTLKPGLVFACWEAVKDRDLPF